MKLPTISTPTYEVKILSREKPLKFRPFLVREQKLMMMAVEAKDPRENINIMKQITKNCVLEDIDVDSLSLVDFEILFLNFRARSMGEIINVYYKCKNEFIGSEDEITQICNMVMDVPINLLEVDVINSENEKRIMISDDVGIQMKLPTFEVIEKLMSTDPDDEEEINDAEYKAAAMCIEYVFDKDSVYYAKDATLDEMMNFIYSLPPGKYEKIENYFKNLPTIRQESEAICSKCGFKHKFVLEGLNDFFI